MVGKGKGLRKGILDVRGEMCDSSVLLLVGCLWVFCGVCERAVGGMAGGREVSKGYG